MFKQWMDTVHNHDNGYLDWLFPQNDFPLRESNSMVSGNGKGFTLEELFRSAVDGLLILFLFAFEFYHSLFRILIIKSSYRVDRWH